jgi:hypothetical protein
MSISGPSLTIIRKIRTFSKAGAGGATESAYYLTFKPFKTNYTDAPRLLRISLSLSFLVAPTWSIGHP